MKSSLGEQTIRMSEGLIPLEKAHERLTASGVKTTLRWISEEARRLKCYRRVGKSAAIPAAAWEYFERGETWPKGEEIASRSGKSKTKTGRLRSTRASKHHTATTTAKSGGDVLSEALELAMRPRPAR